jgi:integrase
MTTRRRRGEDGISFEHRGPCSDPHRHRHCPGLWRGELTTGYTGDGKRQRRKVSGTTKAAVVDKLRDLHTQLDKGITPKAGYAYYTVRQAAQDWLAHGLDGRSPKTITKNQNVLEPILTVIGARKLRDLTAADVRQALSKMAAGYSTAAVSMGHLALKRAIRHAEANDLVSRNVAALADTPKGQDGRPSKSLTLDQAAAVITTARTLPVLELRPGLKDVRRPAELMHAYITLSLLTGIRTEEARALRWAHVDLDGDPAARPPVPPHIAVWRSVRAHGETKTERSRRTLGLPLVAVLALRAWTASQASERLAAGQGWQDTGLVFTTTRAPRWTRATSGRCSSASAPRPASGRAGPRASCAPRSSACSATAASASRRSPGSQGTPPPAPPRSSTAANCDPSSPPAPRSWTSSSQQPNPAPAQDLRQRPAPPSPHH